MESLPAKTCTQCGELKLLTEYSKNSAAKDKLRAACRICDAAARSKYRAENHDEHIAYNLKYYQDNKESERLRKKKWSADNLEYTTAYSKEYHKKNKEAHNAASREYAKNNRDKYNEADRRRRARKLNDGEAYSVTPYSELQVLALYGTDCHICNRPVDMSAPRAVGRPGWETGLHIEHVIPLSKGGPDVLENVRPSHGYCNLSKGDRVR
jgi:5-methylcytosine-specific restriction endonuclease McrA